MNSQTSNFIEQLTAQLESNNFFSLIRFPGGKTFRLNGEVSLLLFGSRWDERFGIYDSGQNLDIFYDSTNRDIYLTKVGELIDELKLNNRKVVISRVIDGKISLTEPKQIASAVDRLFQQNPSAFAAVIRSGRAGLWIVMTPELLIEQYDDKLSTMALAGTRPKGSSSNWDDKNILEQNIVTDCIVKELLNVGLNPTVGETFTKGAGNVEHICTPIEAMMSPDDNIGTIVDSINPTPAVCGLPRDYAIAKIQSIEDHSRLLYAGAIAVNQTSSNLRVFVTLRCIHINSEGRFNIFVGGGITANSVAIDEWNETELKARPFIEAFTNH